MKIVDRLTKRFAAISGVFLVISTSMLSLTYSYYTYISLSQRLDDELKNTSAILSKSYGMGNLITTRENLELLYKKNNWKYAKLRNRRNEVIWKKEIKDQTEKIFIESIFLFKREIEVNNSFNRPMLTLNIVKSFETQMNDYLHSLYSTIAFSVLFWLIFTLITHFVNRRTLKPLIFLLSDVRLEADMLDISLSKRNDEITQIKVWFREIVSAWKHAHKKALQSERDSAIAQTTQMLAHDVRRPFSMIKLTLTIN